MAGSMFNSIISGPVQSKKLGRALSIDLSPTGNKLCSFNCVYCTCADLTPKSDNEQELPQPYAVVEQLVDAIQKSTQKGERIDAIRFLGNGEPTLHPDFDKIISDVVLIRNLLAPDTKIVVFTNGSTILHSNLRVSIAKADDFVIKFDAGSREMFEKINRPVNDVRIDQIKRNLLKFKGAFTVQAMFVSGKPFDNSSKQEVEIWLEQIKEISPKKVYIGTLKKQLKNSELKAVSKKRLDNIASELKSFGFESEVI
ncbi:MAG: radical SAM protein [Flavobacteriales bacterium]